MERYTLAIDGLCRGASGGHGATHSLPRAGQGFVEFALTLTVLATLLVTVIDFGRVFYFDVMTSAAANAGVRAAANGASDANVLAAVSNSVPSIWQSQFTSSNVAISPAEADRAAGATPVWTTVSVTYTFNPLTPVMRGLAGSSVVLRRSASQRIRSGCCA
jgi:Flp pilus assembly protein TadG